MGFRNILGGLIVLLIFASATAAQELSVWHTENDPDTLRAFDEIARAFEAQNPGVKVNATFVGWDDLYRRLTVALRSGELPALTQIQPFMAAYLHQSGNLEPLDDVIDSLDLNDVFPAVRDLQLFDGRRYGIATALGISYYSFRPNFLPREASDPDVRNWSDYLQLVRDFKARDPNVAPLLLPANDLHITLLFTELLASNGGSYFDEDSRPDFANERVIETLTFWRDLYDLVPEGLRNSPYGENFGHYAAGRSFSLPSFFGRGTTQIERTAPEGERNPQSFSMFPHPVGPSGTMAYATLDAEPWVILRGAPNGDLARRFLRFFYREDNYLKFTSSVPIHLTPIFRSLATGTEYTSLPLVVKWRPYFDYQIEMLDNNSILPIFMAREADRFNPALFRLEGSRIISTMVRAVSIERMAPEDAARNAMTSSAQLLEEFATSAQDGESGPAATSLVAIGVVFAAVLAAFWLWMRRRSTERRA